MDMVFWSVMVFVIPWLIDKFRHNPHYGMTWKTDVEGVARAEAHWREYNSPAKKKISY